MANFKLNITSFKVLYTINKLNEKNYYPNIHGVLKLVNGVIDNETKDFISLETFATLISIKGRRMSSIVHQLQRYNYVSLKHDKSDDNMYLYVTFKGESNIEDYLKHHKISFKKKDNKVLQKTIAYIKE